MVLALLNQKGGVGKTTLAIHLAVALTQRKVLLIDADLRASALIWATSHQAAATFPMIGLPANVLHEETATYASRYQAIIINCPSTGE